MFDKTEKTRDLSHHLRLGDSLRGVFESFGWAIERPSLEELPILSSEIIESVRPEINRLTDFYCEGFIIHDSFENNHEGRRRFWKENLDPEIQSLLKIRSQLSLNAWYGRLGDVFVIATRLGNLAGSTDVPSFGQAAFDLMQEGSGYSKLTISEKVAHVANVCIFIKKFFDCLAKIN